MTGLQITRGQTMKTLEERLALRPAEAARVLGVSVRTLFLWAQQKKIPCVKLGKVLLFPVSELQQWLTEQSREKSHDE